MNVKSQNNKEHFIFGACLVLVDFVCVKYKRLRDVVVVPTIFFFSFIDKHDIAHALTPCY